MPEEDPLIFNRFQLWLYTGNIVEAPGQSSPPIGDRTLTDLYILGEARGILGLQNAATDEVIDRFKKTGIIRAREIRHIYDNTSEKSPMRNLYVDMMTELSAELTDPSWDSGATYFASEYFPREFLTDLILALYHKVAVHEPKSYKDFSKDRQQYHVSTSDNQGDIEEEKHR